MRKYEPLLEKYERHFEKYERRFFVPSLGTFLWHGRCCSSSTLLNTPCSVFNKVYTRQLATSQAVDHP